MTSSALPRSLRTAASLLLLLAGCRSVDFDGGTLGFDTAAVTAAEGQTVTLIVTRPADSARRPASLRYRSVDGSARAGEDYAAVDGRLQWSAGDTAPKTIQVSLAADGVFEDADETLQLQLYDPQGAALTDSVATIRVLDQDPVPMQLLAFNDFHGNLKPPAGGLRLPDPVDPAATLLLPAGGVEYLSTQIKQLKAQNPRSTVVAAGDLIGASPLISSLFHDEPAIEALNQLGLEFSSVGNHEFDDGSSELLRVQRGGCFGQGQASATSCVRGPFAGAAFQYLAANVLDARSGRSLLPGYAIKRFDVGGGRSLSVGFIGLVLKTTPAIVTPTGVDGLRFVDEASAANALVPELRAAGVEAIVVLIHEGAMTSGAYNDKRCPDLSGDVLPIADALDPAIDIIVSGHTHNAYNCRRNGRVLTSASSFGRVLTQIRFKLDRITRDVIVDSVDNQVIVNDTAPNPAPQHYPALARDPAQTEIVDFYRDRVAPLENRVVGRISGDLLRAPNESGESTLGNVIADAFLAATRERRSGGAVLAFTNPGGLRTDLLAAQISGGEAPGEVTYGELAAVQPYGNTLTTLTLTGAQIKMLLEQQFPPWQTAPKFLQASAGLRYRYDPSRADNDRIDAASLTIAGKRVQPKARYRVTVNNFLAAGGDGFTVLRNGRDALGGPLDIDALLAYFAASGGRLDVPTLQRFERQR